MTGIEALGSSLEQLHDFLRRHRWKHCLIGGLAVNRWGESRFTRDIDLVVLTGIGAEKAFVDELLNEFLPRASRERTRQFALDNRVVLLNSAAGIPIDISLGALPFEEQMLARAKSATIVRGHKFLVATPEDIIVMKTLAGRPQDWKDIEGIIARQTKLDWAHIHRWLQPLLEAIERPERTAELEALRTRLKSEPESPLTPRTKNKPSSKKKRGS